MTSNEFEPGPLVEVSWTTENGRSTLVFTREFRHSREAVWAALTVAEQIGKWAPFAPNRDLSNTGSATLQMNDGSQPEHSPSEVKRAVPLEILEYTWGDDRLVWELTVTETGTRVTLHHHTNEDPSSLPKNAAGWHICLDVAERLLDGNPVEPILGESAMCYGWGRLHAQYEVLLFGKPQ